MHVILYELVCSHWVLDKMGKSAEKIIAQIWQATKTMTATLESS